MRFPINTNQKTEAYISLQKNISLLKKIAQERSLSIEEIIPYFSGKGKIILLLFFCIPFSQYLGLAIPFGFIIAYLGLRYAFFEKKPWTPTFIAKKKIPSKILGYALGQILYFIEMISKLSYPRASNLLTVSNMNKISGCLISLVGLSLAISLPIPFSGYIGSAAILFTGVGILNDDWVWIFIGNILAIIYVAFVLITINYISITDILAKLLG